MATALFGALTAAGTPAVPAQPAAELAAGRLAETTENLPPA